MNFIIDCQIYPFHIMVHFGNKKGLIMNLKKYGINLSQKDIKGKYKSLFLMIIRLYYTWILYLKL